MDSFSKVLYELSARKRSDIKPSGTSRPQVFADFFKYLIRFCIPSRSLHLRPDSLRQDIPAAEAADFIHPLAAMGQQLGGIILRKIQRLDEAVGTPILAMNCATGLRISEGVSLKVDIRLIQVLLGDKKLETTALYAQIATDILREVVSPLERLHSP